MKKKKLSRIQIDILRAVALYQKEHNGLGCPDDPDVIAFYIERAYELNFWPKKMEDFE
jgi:hypothetical protein